VFASVPLQSSSRSVHTNVRRHNLNQRQEFSNGWNRSEGVGGKCSLRQGVTKHVVTSSPTSHETYFRSTSAQKITRSETSQLTAILHHLGCHYAGKLKDSGMGRLYRPNVGDNTANKKFQHKKGKIRDSLQYDWRITIVHRVRIPAGMAIMPTDVFCDFSQTLQKNAETSSCNDRFLLHSFKFNTVWCYIASFLDSVVIKTLTTTDTWDISGDIRTCVHKKIILKK